jgi:hypothetical protein
VRRLLKEPLIHFLLGGTLLFVLFAWKNRETRPAPDEIVVSSAQVEVLLSGWARTWERPPEPDEVGRIIEDYIREEVYYREALKLGLEQDDTIVRRRLRQKMEFLAEDFHQESDPSDEELQQFLATHPELFQEPALLTFRHIYFSPDRRGNAAAEDASRVLDGLTAEMDSAAVEPLGDPFFHQREFDSFSETAIARVLGRDFLVKLLELTPGKWFGPLRSGYGYHLVQITHRIDGRLPALEEFREAVVRERQDAERERYAEAFYENLRALYSVRVERPRSSGPADGSGANP